MTEERDEAVSRRYRELGAEEPPRALDEAILAAARRPARFSTRRWAVPLSLAAVVVLSVTVTLNIQREAPEMIAAQAPSRPVSPPAPEARNAETGRPDAGGSQATPPAAADSAGARDAPKASSQPEAARPKPFPMDPPVVAEASPPPQSAPAPAAPAAAPAPAIASRAERDSAAASGALSAPRQEAREDQARERASAAPLAKRAQIPETPEQELERIALLRKEGRHDEADKALADFRTRRPDFRIPEAMLERVERR